MEFLNKGNLYESILNVCRDALKEEYPRWQSVAEEFADYKANSILEDMRKYVHLRDTRMSGNFANIREDWDDIKDFVKSNVQPFGKFDAVIESIDNETISAEDLDKFQTWCLDWFYTAFGTYNIKCQILFTIADIECEEG